MDLGKLSIFGLIAVVYAWLVILYCISLNPWFIFTVHAFSDLGAPDANSPWIYNNGMISIGVLIIIYSIYLVWSSVNKLTTVGGSFVFISGIFLMLIGIYPAGTRPHVFVSTWFFIQFDLAIIAWSLGMYIYSRDKLSLSALVIGLIAPVIGFGVDWPSAAMAETFGIIVIDYWVFISFIRSREVLPAKG